MSDTVPRFGVVPSTQRVSQADRDAILRAPSFGRYFTDHMARAVWTRAGGWHDADVRALEPLVLHPSAAVLHYAQEIFEGLKAYRQPDGSVALFRPDMNAARFQRSAARMALPLLPVEMFLDSVETLVRTDIDWVPTGDQEASLYLRPYAVATEAFLGVRPAEEVFYGVIASPAGPYFAAGNTGITLWVSTDFVRAAPGGTGAAKCGGNYAASLLPQVQAQEQGCDQVLYTVTLDGEPYIDESGTMNVFLVTGDGELITPSLGNGTILSGVTRDSVLTLAKSYDLNPVERQVSLAEVLGGVADGRFVEVFAAGTAAVITPITGLKTAEQTLTVGAGTPGAISEQLRRHIVDIQFGRRPDEHGWLHPIGQ
jgi:branched-chain amino acid aminotransferase